MSRKALVCGIDHYSNSSPLFGCVNDAHSVNAALERNADGTVNFSTRLLIGTGPTQDVTRRELRQAVTSLFSGEDDIALFYFAGHGYIEQTGGYLICSDTVDGNDGLSLQELMTFANQSRARNRIIILDCCHSGIAGTASLRDEAVQINIGVTVLTASTTAQYASEANGSGLFTSLLIDALNGGAANLLGDITPGSVYAHIDQSLGAWDQRPMFKTNVTTFTSLRKVLPPIPLEVLRNIHKYFNGPGYELQLDPDYEPQSATPNPEKNRVFHELQAMAKVNLVKPVGEDHMYFAAMNSRSCRMTVLGEHYWRLIQEKII